MLFFVLTQLKIKPANKKKKQKKPNCSEQQLNTYLVLNVSLFPSRNFNGCLYVSPDSKR